MESDRLEQIAALFDAARQLGEKERAAWLREATGRDRSLEREVLSLLAEYDAGDSELEPGPGAAMLREWIAAGVPLEAEQDAPALEVPGFRILSLLGEGAQGAVYEAEQLRPLRVVALKVMKPHLGAEDVTRRFEREAETLARLQHPGIAVIHESGFVETAFGLLPYFAMELVRGPTVLDYCIEKGLGHEARVELLAQVCAAVAHAHANGVVHRDLKPSNILVDSSGRSRVLDFGVARVLDAGGSAEAGNSSLTTRTGQVIGTLAYMSPEQASAQPDAIDARTDVFALGVIAFEVLTGQLPRDLSDLPFAEQVRLLAEGETSLLGVHDSSLRGDLETIVAKAMASEQGRRYADAGALAAEFRRYLSKEPITARPATTLYYISRFLRRHRALSASLAALFLALVTGTIVSTKLFFDARVNEESALWRSYVANVSWAATSLDSGGGFGVADRLDRCPEPYRSWEWRYLMRRADQSLDVLADPRTPGQSAGSFVHAVAYSPTGEYVAAASHPVGMLGGTEHALRVWRSGDGELVGFTESMKAQIWSLAFTPDGGGLVSTGRTPDGLWGMNSETVLWSLPAALPPDSNGPPSPVEPMLIQRSDRGGVDLAEWHERGVWAIATTDGLFLWDTRDGAERVVATGGLRSIAVSPDGSHFAGGTSAGTVRVWAGDDVLLEEPEPVWERDLVAFASRHVDRDWRGVLDLEYTPDGSELMAALGSGDVVSLRAADGAIHRITRVCREPVSALARLDQGRLLASGFDGTLRILDVESSRVLETLHGHRAMVTSLAVGPRGDFVSGAKDCTVRRWPQGGGRSAITLDGIGRKEFNEYATSFSPSGDLLAWHVDPRTIAVSDAATGQERFRVAPAPERAEAVGFDASGERLFVAAIGRGVDVWSADNGDAIEQRPIAEMDLLTSSSAFGPGCDVFAFGRKEVNSGGEDNARTPSRIALLRTDTWASVASWKVDSPADSLQFTPDGRRLLSGHLDASVRIWDARTGELQYRFDIPGRHVFPLIAIDAEGRRVAFTLADPSDPRLYLWDPGSGHPPRILPGESSYTRVAFHPSEPRFFAGTWDGGISVFNLERGEIFELKAHEGVVSALLFSPDGKRLVTADGTGAHRIWFSE